MALIGTLTSGVSALQSFTKGLEVIGNNISNVNTTGYKSSQVRYEDAFSNTLRDSAPSLTTASNTTAMQVGTGVRIGGITSRFTQGVLNTTGAPTDLGISGNGFFIVQNPTDSSSYATRAGNFRQDDQGYIVTNEGYRLQGSNGSVRVGQSIPTGAQLKSFAISPQGNLVEAYSDGTSATTQKVLLQSFQDTSALQKVGNNLFTNFTAAGPLSTTLSSTSNSPGTAGLGNIEAGTLELSNVDLTNEMTDMITAQRSFQGASRVVTVSDSVLEEIINLKR
jgi:flagellar hook protein FlgE